MILGGCRYVLILVLRGGCGLLLVVRVSDIVLQWDDSRGI